MKNVTIISYFLAFLPLGLFIAFLITFLRPSKSYKKAVFLTKDLKDGIWYAHYEVKVIAESEDCYEIKRWWFWPSKWIPKKAIGVKLDFIK